MTEKDHQCECCFPSFYRADSIGAGEDSSIGAGELNPFSPFSTGVESTGFASETFSGSEAVAGSAGVTSSFFSTASADFSAGFFVLEATPTLDPTFETAPTPGLVDPTLDVAVLAPVVAPGRVVEVVVLEASVDRVEEAGVVRVAPTFEAAVPVNLQVEHVDSAEF